MGFNPTSFAEVMLALEEKINAFKGTISVKRRSGRTEYYHQFCEKGVRREVYIRKSDVPKALKAFDLKKRQKQELRRMKSELKALPQAVRKEVRDSIKLCVLTDHLHHYEHARAFEAKEAERAAKARKYHRKIIRRPAEIGVDGTHVRSQPELLCLGLAQSLNLEVEYEPRLFVTNYIPDFLVRRLGSGNDPNKNPICYWEHLGMLEDPVYRAKQRQKLRDYRREGYRVGQNLIITSSKKHVDLQETLWKLVLSGVLKPREALRKLATLQKRHIQEPENLEQLWESLA